MQSCVPVPPCLYLLCYHLTLINNRTRSPVAHYDTFPVKLCRAGNNAPSAQDWENRLYAWESDMLCSLYTPPTNLSIVKMGGWGSIKTLHPTWQGPVWEKGPKVFIVDTWPLLQKHTLNALKRGWRNILIWNHKEFMLWAYFWEITGWDVGLLFN